MFQEQYARLTREEKHQLVDAAANPVLRKLIAEAEKQLREDRLNLRMPEVLDAESCMKFTLQYDDLARRENAMGGLLRTLQTCVDMHIVKQQSEAQEI